MASSSAPHAPHAPAPGPLTADEVDRVPGVADHAEYNAAPLHAPPARVAAGAAVGSLAAYRAMHARSLAEPDAFWGEQARARLSWSRDFVEVSGGGFEAGDVRWFAGGQLNVAENCLDRHVRAGKGGDVALIWEGDEPGSGRSYTYAEALAEVCKIANVLALHGVRRGDAVAVYLPMIPAAPFTMLACARLGAVHSVIFAGFSAEAVRDRVLDAGAKWVVTADEGRRGGRSIACKAITDAAVGLAPCVQKVFVFARTGADVPMGSRDVRMADAMAGARPYCPAVPMDAEDPLFLLYTSGSTGKPKGVQHTTAGYLLYAAMTTALVFDLRPGDVYACMADVGWVTGHSYIVYGPLANGGTSLLFESTPLYPDASRYWDVVARHRVTQFYTAPTALRALMRFGDAPVAKHDLSSLRVLGSVGEPINPEAWNWYHRVVGGGRCAVVDTFWQTETGGHMITPLPGATPTKPGSACLPFFGVDVVIKDREGRTLAGNDVAGVVCVGRPWPGLARTVYGDHKRYLDTYMRPFPGTYFTGDGGVRDKDGYIWITGRVDDVLNVSGHRLGSAEIESALVGNAKVSEAAVVGFPHDTKGEGICCYVTLKEGVPETPDVAAELRATVRKVIGPFATPDHIVLTSALPKTRSGKIMRRILRKVVAGEADKIGDVTTLADPGVVTELVDKVGKLLAAAAAAASKAGGGGGTA